MRICLTCCLQFRPEKSGMFFCLENGNPENATLHKPSQPRVRGSWVPTGRGFHSHPRHCWYTYGRSRKPATV